MILSDGVRPTVEDDSREANHRIANNLSVIAGLVRLHAADATARRDRWFSATDVRVLLDEIGARIDAVGRLHRLLSSQTGDTIDLSVYVADTAETLTASLADLHQVALSCRGTPGCYLHPDQAAPVALIVSELVTNAIKHAHPAGAPGKIVVRCGPGLNGSVYVEVDDDGVGLPEDFDPWKNGGLGFEIIRGLAQQLGAKLIFDAEGIGLRVRLMVPAPGVESA